MSNEQQKSSHVLDMRRRIATHCNTLKHTATNWNTFQYAWALQNACRLDIVCLQSHCVTVFVHTLITTLKSPQQKWYSYASHVQAYCYDSTACWACAQVVVCVYKHSSICHHHDVLAKMGACMSPTCATSSSMCLSIYLSVYLYINLFVYLSIYLCGTIWLHGGGTLKLFLYRRVEWLLYWKGPGKHAILWVVAILQRVIESRLGNLMFAVVSVTDRASCIYIRKRHNNQVHAARLWCNAYGFRSSVFVLHWAAHGDAHSGVCSLLGVGRF